MASKPISLEQFLEGHFPAFGLDLSGQIGEQRQLTTREATNVRLYDVLEMRARGGSRGGLSRFVNEKVSGTNRIDHLNVITDPTPLAMPGAQNELEATEGVADSSTNNFKQRVPADTRVRAGGSGINYKFRKLLLTIIADDQEKTLGQVFTFAGTEFTTEGLEILDSVSSVTLTSTGTPAAALAGEYAIIASKAQGHAAFHKNLTDKYRIVYQPGALTIPPPGTWVFTSLDAVWDVGPFNFLDEQSNKAGQFWSGIEGERYREVATAASITGPSGSWSAQATFRDITWNFFNINFAPNGFTDGQEPGPIDGIGHAPVDEETYTSTLTLTLAGSFTNYAGTFVYDCGTVVWTAVWTFQAA